MPKWAKILIGIVAVVAVIGIGFFIYLKVAFIEKDEVKENIADYIKVDEDDLYFENIDLELENKQYEVDFYYNNNEYEAKVEMSVPVENRKRFKGKILAINPQNIVSFEMENVVYSLPFDEISKAKIVITDALLAQFAAAQDDVDL